MLSPRCRAALGDATGRANVIKRDDANPHDDISLTREKTASVDDPAPPASGDGGFVARVGGEQMVADSLDASEMRGGSSFPKQTTGSSGREVPALSLIHISEPTRPY